MLKHAGSFEIMSPEDIGLNDSNLVMGKHSGRAALRKKLEDLGYAIGDNKLKDLFIRFKELADRKKEIFDDDLIALMSDTATHEANDFIKLVKLEVSCGTETPQEAKIVLQINETISKFSSTGDGPVDAVFKAIKELFPHEGHLQLFQVHAVTEGTDAQATVSVRMEENGKITTGQSSDTDTVVASAKAYINALNKLLHRRGKQAPNSLTS
jgi:2-isopropylmalate synthase